MARAGRDSRDILEFVQYRIRRRVLLHVLVCLLAYGVHYGVSYQFLAFYTSGNLVDTIGWALIVVNCLLGVAMTTVAHLMVLHAVRLELTEALRHVETRSGATATPLRFPDYMKLLHKEDLRGNPFLQWVLTTARTAAVNYKVYLATYTVAVSFFLFLCLFTPRYIPWFTPELGSFIYRITFGAVEGLAVALALATLPCRLPDLADYPGFQMTLPVHPPEPMR